LLSGDDEHSAPDSSWELASIIGGILELGEDLRRPERDHDELALMRPHAEPKVGIRIFDWSIELQAALIPQDSEHWGELLPVSTSKVVPGQIIDQGTEDSLMREESPNKELMAFIPRFQVKMSLSLDRRFSDLTD
jgi:hypothetical protein